ncbi:MAG: hypothetical protein ACI9LE_000058 [Paraglaciecola sp.]|jgi:hypothetical protein
MFKNENAYKTYEDFSIDTPEGRAHAFGRHDHARWYVNDYQKNCVR